MYKTNTTKRMTILFIFVTLFYMGQSLASVIVFTDRALWESAVGNFSTETFDDSLLNPGLTVISSADFDGVSTDVSGGVYNGSVLSFDVVVEDTYLYFDRPIRALGGDWDLSSDSLGSGLNFSLKGSDPVSVNGGRHQGIPDTYSDIPNTYTGEFWGILSEIPFEYVQIIGGGQNYTLDNLVYSRLSIIPEPNSLLLFALGLLGFTYFRQIRTNNT